VKCRGCEGDRRTFYWVPGCRNETYRDAQLWEENGGVWVSLLL
jgi:hypothetical protein